jgi:hypothetical protein
MFDIRGLLIEWRRQVPVEELIQAVNRVRDGRDPKTVKRKQGFSCVFTFLYTGRIPYDDDARQLEATKFDIVNQQSPRSRAATLVPVHSAEPNNGLRLNQMKCDPLGTYLIVLWLYVGVLFIIAL